MTLEEIQRREAKSFLPVVGRMPVALVEGRGTRVRDVAGREYVDLTGGWGVTAIGHCHPALVAAISEQAGRLMQTTNLYYTLPQLDLAETLAEITPPEITRSFLVNSGTEAVEGAIKLAHRANGRRKFVATSQSFHGRTLGALGVIGQPKHREPYRALLQEPVVVPFDDLEAAAQAIDAETAAVIVEPIQGEGGVNVPGDGYLRGLRKLCDAAGALLILDEIQTGIGRTGRMLALEHEGVVPDILTLGKGLGGGFPVAAFLCSEGIAETVQLGDHGGTYVGNPRTRPAGGPGPRERGAGQRPGESRPGGRHPGQRDRQPHHAPVPRTQHRRIGALRLRRHPPRPALSPHPAPRNNLSRNFPKTRIAGGGRGRGARIKRSRNRWP
jgi:acetylornithine/succinyldiaminopimelate/putrescine aminotransferase